MPRRNFPGVRGLPRLDRNQLRLRGEQERQQLRSCVMSGMWMGREARFDGIGTSAILARRVNDATVATIIDANALVKHYKQNL